MGVVYLTILVAVKGLNHPHFWIWCFYIQHMCPSKISTSLSHLPCWGVKFLLFPSIYPLYSYCLCTWHPACPIAGYWCTRSINASPIVVVNSKAVWIVYANGFWCKNIFSTDIPRVFAMKKMWTVSPHIYRGFSFALAIFTANSHPVCQPVQAVKLQWYHSKNASLCVCHKLKL